MGTSKGKSPRSENTASKVEKKSSAGLTVDTVATTTSAETTTKTRATSSSSPPPQSAARTSSPSKDNKKSAMNPSGPGSGPPLPEPLAVGSNITGGSGSVVEDLMEVYNNMTQSKTPYVPPGGGGGQQHYQAANNSQSGPGFEHGSVPAGYQAAAASSGYTIPPPLFQSSPSSSSQQQQQQDMTYSSPGGHHHPPPPERSHNAPSFNFDSGNAFSPPHAAGGHQNQHSPQYHHGNYHPAPQDQFAPPPPSSQQNDAGDDQADSSGRSRRKRRSSIQEETTVVATQSASSSGGDGSKSGGGGKSKKKSKNSDGRWSKRFTWPEDLHRDFVSAIFDVGLKHSSPSTILEHMPKHEQITTERIKSHLQKYRLHRAKSKKEFMASYEASLRNFQSTGGAANGPSALAGGDMAAHLTYSTSTGASTTDDQPGAGSSSGSVTAPGATSVTPVANASSSTVSGSDQKPATSASPIGRDTGTDAVSNPANDQSNALMLPQLSEAEKQSPIGSAMGYLMGLFFSLKQQLMIQRSLEAAGEKARVGNSQVQDVFNSFAAQGNAQVSAAIGLGLGMDSAAMTQAIATAAAAAQPIPSTAMPSVRTDMEENTLMKREMQNQMALQNKMRALKQQELAKYKNVPASSGNSKQGPGHMTASAMDTSHCSMGGGMTSASTAQPTKEDEDPGFMPTASHGQGSGETDGTDSKNSWVGRPRGLSIGASEDFWNTDMVDDQLFEFLMNN